jgi:hypothetical protein
MNKIRRDVERREADRPIASNRWNCDSETKQTLRSHKLMNHQPFVQNFFDTFLIVFQTIVRQREKRLLSSKKVLGMFFSDVKGERSELIVLPSSGSLFTTVEPMTSRRVSMRPTR